MQPQWSKRPSLELIAGFDSPSLIRTLISVSSMKLEHFRTTLNLMLVQSFLSGTLSHSNQGVT